MTATHGTAYVIHASTYEVATRASMAATTVTAKFADNSSQSGPRGLLGGSSYGVLLDRLFTVRHDAAETVVGNP